MSFGKRYFHDGPYEPGAGKGYTDEDDHGFLAHCVEESHRLRRRLMNLTIRIELAKGPSASQNLGNEGTPGVLETCVKCANREKSNWM